MPHSYISQLTHCVFSTKERRHLTAPELQQQLFPYIGGIPRKNEIKLIAAGPVADHVHTLISLPRTMSISKAMQLIKGGASKWIHDTFPEHQSFEWQEGYAAFSVSMSNQDKVVAYINSQPEHHKKQDFRDEFLLLLDRHGVEYDEKYLFD